MSLREQIHAHREAVLEAAGRHAAKQIRLFGSAARGDERPDSDIDLLVERVPGTSLFDHVALTAELERLLVRRVEIASERWLRPAVAKRVQQEVQPIS
jgi:predicted nucleotidyltransferase